MSIKKLTAFSLIEMLLAACLVGLVSVLAVGSLNIAGQVQGIQSNKIVQAAIMEVQAAFVKEKRANGMIDQYTPWVAFLDRIDGTIITTNLQIDGESPTSPSFTCNTGVITCRRLKSGAVLVYWRDTNLLWGACPIYAPRNVRVSGMYIDPDGIDSAPTNDAGQGVKLLFTMEGSFLPSTDLQWDRVIDPVSETAAWANMTQPRYFTLER
jgi:type II secretory pathway pseudopilin PulG